MSKYKTYFILFLIVLLSFFAAWFFYPDLFKNLDPEESDGEGFVQYVNRLIIFIFGLTVSANIYLYTTRNNISSSIMWLSNQIGFLILTIFSNIIVLIIGSFILYYDFFLDHSFLVENYKLVLVSYVISFLTSITLFSFTLIKFISVFRVDKNMTRTLKKVRSKIYPVTPYRVYKERKQISDHALSILENLKLNKSFKTITTPLLTSRISRKSSVKELLRKIDSAALKTISIITYFKICLLRKNNFLVRTLPYSKQELIYLNLQIEIYTQNLEYIVKRNSNKSMTQHFTQWNAIFSQLTVMLFHIKTPDDKSDEIVNMYKSIMNYHSKLIIATSQSYEHQNFYNDLVLTLFKALAYKEEAYHNVSKNEFKKRTLELEEVYFKELFSLFIVLLKDKKFEIIDLLQTEGLSINSFMNVDKGNGIYYGDESRLERYEELSISILIRMVELDINDKLSAVMAILLSLEEKPKSSEHMESPSLLTSTKEKAVKQVSPKAGNLNISHKNRVGLYNATIKANELENYKAAGYFVKVLTSNLEYLSIEKIMAEFSEDRTAKRKINYNTGVYKLDFNDYSYQYCIDKTLILFNIQYFMKRKIQLTDRLKSILKIVDTTYFIEKLEDKSKEYNMIALKSDTVNEFRDFLKKEISHSMKVEIPATDNSKRD